MTKAKSSTTKYLIYGGIYLAIIALIVVFGIWPKSKNLKTDQKNLADTKAELDTATQKRTNLEELSKNKTQIDTINLVTMDYIPPDKQNSSFVVQVEALAKELNIIITNFAFTEAKTQTPAASSGNQDQNTASTSKSQSTSSSQTSPPQSTTTKQEAKNYSEFSLNFSSDYGAMQKFLEKLESFPRINLIDTINLSGYVNDKNTLNLRVTGRIFYGK